MAGYRKCAGIVVFNGDKKVLVCARKDGRRNQWQFPQGGIMENEKPEEAAIRELAEETSLTSVELVKTLERSVRYSFPDSVRRKLLRRGIDSLGQEMFWNLLYFCGADSEINLKTEEPEFKAWEWVDIDEAVRRIVPFKKEAYQQAAQAFKPVLNAFICK